MIRWSFILFCVIAFHNVPAQGLENIIVETYYITDSNDSLKWGSDKIGHNYVTYRIYVDMKPGYSLQSVYGSPGHPLKLSASNSLFNHSVHGKYIANMVWSPLLNDGLVMLDSWLSMGAGCQGKYAVLKQDDDTMYTVKNASRPMVLQSENLLAGVPLKLRDGLIAADSLPPRVTQIGLDSLLFLISKDPLVGEKFEFVTDNGGWGCLGGAKGYFPEKNYVCIGQITTDGDFYFEFNVQIGSPEKGIEQYVAREPVGNERLFPGLIVSKKSLIEHKK